MSNDSTDTPRDDADHYGAQPDYGQPDYGQPDYGQPDHGQQQGQYGAQGSPDGRAGGPVGRPDSITRAVQLMRIGALLSLLGILATFLMQDQIRDEVERSLRESGTAVTQDNVDAAVTLGLVFAGVLGLIGVGLWLWMAAANGKGRSWARIVATVLYGLYAVSFLFSFTQPQPILTTVTSLVSLVLGGVIIYLLWQRSSSAYYQAMSGSR